MSVPTCRRRDRRAYSSTVVVTVSRRYGLTVVFSLEELLAVLGSTGDCAVAVAVFVFVAGWVYFARHSYDFAFQS